jgi:hypothetical protein
MSGAAASLAAGPSSRVPSIYPVAAHGVDPLSDQSQRISNIFWNKTNVLIVSLEMIAITAAVFFTSSLTISCCALPVIAFFVSNYVLDNEPFYIPNDVSTSNPVSIVPVIKLKTEKLIKQFQEIFDSTKKLCEKDVIPVGCKEQLKDVLDDIARAENLAITALNTRSWNDFGNGVMRMYNDYMRIVDILSAPNNTIENPDTKRKLYQTMLDILNDGFKIRDLLSEGLFSKFETDMQVAIRVQHDNMQKSWEMVNDLLQLVSKTPSVEPEQMVRGDSKDRLGGASSASDDTTKGKEVVGASVVVLKEKLNEQQITQELTKILQRTHNLCEQTDLSSETKAVMKTQCDQLDSKIPNAIESINTKNLSTLGTHIIRICEIYVDMADILMKAQENTQNLSDKQKLLEKAFLILREGLEVRRFMQDLFDRFPSEIMPSILRQYKRIEEYWKQVSRLCTSNKAALRSQPISASPVAGSEKPAVVSAVDKPSVIVDKESMPAASSSAVGETFMKDVVVAHKEEKAKERIDVDATSRICNALKVKGFYAQAILYDLQKKIWKFNLCQIEVEKQKIAYVIYEDYHALAKLIVAREVSDDEKALFTKSAIEVLDQCVHIIDSIKNDVASDKSMQEKEEEIRKMLAELKSK